MRSLITLPSVLAVLVLLGATIPGADAERDGIAGARFVSAGDAGLPADRSSQDISCWLRNGTVEEALERPSPLGQTEIVLGSHVGKICYGRPSARDRIVEGGLIPFDAPWRLGANEATVIHLPFPARVGGIDLEPGEYSLYVNAGESEWEFVLNSNAQRWGIPFNDAVRAADIATFKSTPQTLADPMEQFTIHWRADGGDNGRLVLEWGTTRVEIEIGLRGDSERTRRSLTG
jgi:hypothetical protein